MQKPVNGKTAHEDTDETKVLSILSVVILVLTILTIGSYADDQELIAEKTLISEKSFPNEQNRSPFMINTNNPSNKVTDEKVLKM